MTAAPAEAAYEPIEAAGPGGFAEVIAHLAPGRFDRPLAALRHDLANFNRTGSLNILTEQTQDEKERFEILDLDPWDYYRGTGPGREDGVIMHDSREWAPLSDGWTPLLTEKTYYRNAEYGGGKVPPFHATCRRLLHIPSGQPFVVTGGHLALTNGTRRVESHEACLVATRALMIDHKKKWPDHKRLTGMDWNHSWRSATARKALVAKVTPGTGMTFGYDGRTLPKERSLIDQWFADVVMTEHTMLPTVKSSDHQPVRLGFRVPILVAPDPQDTRVLPKTNLRLSLHYLDEAIEYNAARKSKHVPALREVRADLLAVTRKVEAAR